MTGLQVYDLYDCRKIRIIRSWSCMNADRWSDLELIGEILDGETLSAAARAMGVDQTTFFVGDHSNGGSAFE